VQRTLAVRSLVIGLACLAGFLVNGSGRAAALPCGLPESRPLWVDFADRSVDFRMTLFGKPGLVLAANGIDGPAQLRALGAQTVYWHMQLRYLVGTAASPADPASVAPAGEALVEKAAASSACATPLIALNELSGAHRMTPWSPEHAQYRANVLTLVKTMAARGAVPFLLVPGASSGARSPWVGGEAAAWWQELARYSHIVREMHFSAPFVSSRGAHLGSRLRRMSMRRALGAFTAIGIPADRLGLLLGFQSGRGKGGREGLQPREAWLEVVKLETLAARQVASELGISTVWSWGWGTFGPGSEDPDKPLAACVHLWTRDPILCDGPAAAGHRFETSLSEGQILLADGIQCRTSLGTITSADVDALAALTGSRESALTALLERLVYEHKGGVVTTADVQEAERALVAGTFAGFGDYLSELERRGVARAVVRDILADQFRRQAAEAVLAIENPALPAARWAKRRKKEGLRTATCLRDELPRLGSIDWSMHGTFLHLPDARASIRARAQVVRRGRPATLFGRVSSLRAYEVVQVYARRPKDGSFRQVGVASVGADGGWSLRVVPSAKTTYRALSRSAASSPVVVRVRGK
jgi:hypothetical protein